DDTPGVDYVENVTVLQISTQEEDLNLPAFAVGLQIGIRSTIGVDSQLGASRTLGADRLLRNESGELVAIVLRPWELLRVTIAGKDIRSAGKETGENA